MDVFKDFLLVVVCANEGFKNYKIKKQYIFLKYTIFMLCQALFSSPEHKVLKVSFCDGPLSVVHCPSVRPCLRASTISLNNIFSETAFWILTKLHRNDPWVVPNKSCSNRSRWLHK